ncbi:gamma-D-glutamyl-meso-diaminopimelate peptidase [Neobacillus bataviensis LMG 21833]|uniref:Gamma-D-glutamyl-meso-diaminopimelate peptidase n=1 Tax=Neobacillus bataviensis LMG 21833 TaxID=1117379 RepID=K6C563_9BACI|nr:M14 family metallopeptidase [Neobacillus bataviensis]EKN66275.1 gamma-D-glutamyl-meso-diaminopimelate peptidase [Neobacillus bataviensis LMG 21833]
MEVVVRSGDTLSYYSHLYKLPLDLIVDSNPKVKPNDLKPGETIYLPERMPTPLITGISSCDYKRLVKIINDFKRVYPFITVNTIGTSVLGNPIHEIRIGTGAKKIHMNASFHANEWITTMVLMCLVNQYLLALTNGALMKGSTALNLYQEVELSIVPMVNPDGVDLVLNGPPSHLKEEIIRINEGSDDFVHWKANINGIDLNNQFPANWDICKQNKQPKAPAPRDFPGSAPLTEPEAAAMAELVRKNSFDCVLAFHTQGKEFYWGYEGHEPPESEKLAKEFEKVSGYQAIQYVNSHAGFKDWFIQEFKRPGFTLELGKGINPLPLSQFLEILKSAEGIFLAALKY